MLNKIGRGLYAFGIVGMVYVVMTPDTSILTNILSGFSIGLGCSLGWRD